MTSRIFRDDRRRQMERDLKAYNADPRTTIRGELKRRARRPYMVIYASSAVLAILVFMSIHDGETFPGGIVIFGSAMSLSLIGLLFGFFYLLRRIRCPICNEPFGSDAYRVRFRPVGHYSGVVTPIRDCPNCGVDLDDPMPDAAQRGAESVTTPDKLIWK